MDEMEAHQELLHLAPGLMRSLNSISAQTTQGEMRNIYFYFIYLFNLYLTFLKGHSRRLIVSRGLWSQFDNTELVCMCV